MGATSRTGYCSALDILYLPKAVCLRNGKSLLTSILANGRKRADGSESSKMKIRACTGRALTPMAFIGASAATGAGISMLPHDLLALTSSPGPYLALGPVFLVTVAYALVRLGSKAVASCCLYASALGIAVPSVRVTDFMTASDLSLLLAGVFLLPEIPNLRLRTTVQRGFATGVTLILIGGLLSIFGTDDAGLSALNLVRLVVAAGATLTVFILWAPSTAQLKRFLVLVVVSGLVSGIWALTHPQSNFGRPSGFAEHPNHLALICLVAVGPAIAFSLIPGAQRARRFVAGGATGILVGSIIVSGSRSGLAGLATAVFVAALLVRVAATRVQLALGATAILLIALVGFSTLTPENAVSRSFGGEVLSAARSDAERQIALSEMIDQIRGHPITGVGFLNPLGGHDAYLQLWAAGGIFAFVGGLVVVGSAVAAATLSRGLARPRSIYDPSWPLLATTISLSALLVALAFQSTLWSRYIWISVALVAVSSAITRSDSVRPAEPLHRSS